MSTIEAVVSYQRYGDGPAVAKARQFVDEVEAAIALLEASVNEEIPSRNERG